FEWRFEFPEVLDDNGDFIGFDAIIGNPPYIRQEELKPWKRHLSQTFQVYAGTADLLVYFFELSFKIMRPAAYFCMISSNKFIKANYGKKLRAFLNSQQLLDIIDFGELPVFEEAATFPAIFLMQKKERVTPVRFTQVNTLDFHSLAALTAATGERLPDDAFGEEFWSLGNAAVNRLLAKIRENGTPLGEYTKGEIYRGVLTGLNKAFVIDAAKKEELIQQDPRSAEIIYPFAIGDDVRFYHIRDKQRYIILTKIGVEIENYPAIFEHLKQYQQALEKRWDKGNHWWELRACAYYEAFEKPKIVYPDIAKERRFALSEDTLYFANTCYFLTSGEKSLLALLNSKLIWFYYSQIATVMGNAKKGGRLRWFRQDVSKLPIASLKAHQKQLEDIANQILTRKKADPQADTAIFETQIDQLVYQLYGLTDDEISIIENAVK
ncbi:Eco57I restriction-modification methylase domain-containing protein, partial [bacterium]|nr:Eco57I restriction-modification methylase domain-containing protein [bacterium]